MTNLVEKAPFKVGDTITIDGITGVVLMFHELGKGLKVFLDLNFKSERVISCSFYLYEKDFDNVKIVNKEDLWK